jgi:hypothetical protein
MPTPLIPVVYGMPGNELGVLASMGLVSLGGCCIGEADPAFICPHCQQYRQGFIRQKLSREQQREINRYISERVDALEYYAKDYAERLKL